MASNHESELYTWAKWFVGLIFSLEKQIDWIGNWGISRALYLSIVYVALFAILAHQIPNLPLFAFSWLVATAPVWLPIGLAITCWHVWIWYIQSLFLSGRSPVLLEVKMPREVSKSPRAMEVALTAFSISSGETTFVNRAWSGQVRPFFSLEIAGIGGEVHFYIWCWKNYRSIVEAAIYSQYPEVELVEAEDYASKFRYDPSIHSAFCTEWRKESYIVYKDPKTGNELKVDAGSPEINAYQIRTYIDFELDKDPKEEFKIDPISHIIEFIGSLKPEEQIWMQIVFRKHGNHGILIQKEKDREWEKMVKKEVEKIREEAMRRPGDHEDPKDAIGRFPHPTETQKMQLQSIERNLMKYPFEVGMRGMYITRGEMRGPVFTANRWLWRPLGNPNSMVHLRPRRWHNPFDYPWQDIGGFRSALATSRFIDAFRRRSVFHSPWVLPTNVFTNEELATMWHPPSRAIVTPGLARIPATKAEPPANLPR